MCAVHRLCYVRRSSWPARRFFMMTASSSVIRQSLGCDSRFVERKALVTACAGINMEWCTWGWQFLLVSIWNGVHGADNSCLNINLESRPSLSWDVMQRCYAHCAVNLRSCNDLGLQFLVETWSKRTLNTTQPSLWINFCDQISTEYMSYT
jgi:hypothetical protein